MPTRSNALDFASSIQHAAAIVTEGTAMFTPEELAGQYAADCAKQAGHPDADSIAAHLEFLADAGAKFNATQAQAFGLAHIATI